MKESLYLEFYGRENRLFGNLLKGSGLKWPYFKISLRGAYVCFGLDSLPSPSLAPSHQLYPAALRILWPGTKVSTHNRVSIPIEELAASLDQKGSDLLLKDFRGPRKTPSGLKKTPLINFLKLELKKRKRLKTEYHRKTLFRFPWRFVDILILANWETLKSIRKRELLFHSVRPLVRQVSEPLANLLHDFDPDKEETPFYQYLKKRRFGCLQGRLSDRQRLDLGKSVTSPLKYEPTPLSSVLRGK